MWLIKSICGGLGSYSNSESIDSRYLYVFGYCTPSQVEHNERHGWDDEDSYAFFVEAPSENAALRWGQEISERYVAQLWDRLGRADSYPGWVEGEYANWIERSPLSRFSGMALETLPVVKYEEIPDLDAWLEGRGFGKLRER